MRFIVAIVVIVIGSKALAATMPVAYSQLSELTSAASPVKIAYGVDELNFIEKWPAQAASEQDNAIVFIHGGCWLNAYDIAHSRPFTEALAQHGYLTYSVEYRRTGDEGGGWPGTFNDVQQAIEAVRANTDKPLVLMGHSAGGHLALLAAQGNAKQVSAVVGLAAITDLVAYSQGSNGCQQATTSFMGGSATELSDAYQAANPSNEQLEVPIVLLHGSADPIVPVDNTNKLAASVGIIQGAGHFDLIHPQTVAFEQLLDVLAKSN